MNQHYEEELGLGMDELYLIQSEPEQEIQDKKIGLDSFYLLSVIGKGSYAKVVQVRKKDNQKIYALKMLKKSYIKKRKQVNHIKTERNILSKSNHPFIVKLAYAFQSDKKLYFCMEYCPGGELYNLLTKKNKLNEDQARFYAAQMVLAIQYLHSNQIIYRDLKPENVLIDRDGYIKLTDFGLSKEGINTNFGAQSRCGTPEYLAPEILTGNHGKAVDWWTLGAILYEMVSGWPPYYADSRDKLFYMIKNEQVKLDKICFSSDLKDLLMQLFEKNPDKRLGGSDKGGEEIKKHQWFKQINWDDIYNKKVQPFFIPRIVNDYDVSNFDEQFVNEPIGSFSSSQPGTSNQLYESKFAIYQSTLDFSFQQLSPTNISPQNDKNANFQMQIEETQ